MKIVEYHRRVLALPKGKLILLGQGALVLAAMWFFIQTVPWLMAYDISEIDRYENPSPSPPDWARAFSVNHGTYKYYGEIPSDSPVRFYGIIIGFIVYGIVYGIVWVRWTRWAWKQGGGNQES